MPAETKTSQDGPASLQRLQQRVGGDPYGVFVECEQASRQLAELALEALGQIEEELVSGTGGGDDEIIDAVRRFCSKIDCEIVVDDLKPHEAFEQAMIVVEGRQARYRAVSERLAGTPRDKEPIPLKRKKKAAKKVASKAKKTTPDEIDKGSRVRIIKGKEGVGVEGEVFWWGDSKYGDNMRAGVRGEDGETYWVDDTALELA